MNSEPLPLLSPMNNNEELLICLDFGSLFKGIVTISQGNSVYICYLNITYEFSPHTLLRINLVEYFKLDSKQRVL